MKGIRMLYRLIRSWVTSDVAFHNIFVSARRMDCCSVEMVFKYQVLQAFVFAIAKGKSILIREGLV